MFNNILVKRQEGNFTQHGGQALWFPVMALIAFGILFVYSASSVYAAQKFGSEFIFVKKQFMYIFPGIIAAYLGTRISLDWLLKHSVKILVVALFFVALTKVPYIGHKVGGASRWVALGPFQFQPSEFLKIAGLLFATHQLTKEPTKLLKLWPVGVAFVLLILQPDFGSTMIMLLGIVSVLFIHGTPKRLFFGGLAALIPVVVGVMIFEPYRVRRLVTFLDPFADPLGAGFQVIQSLVALAGGGWFGKGLGGSQQKLFFLPEAHTDFIFAVIAEEMGYAGVLIITFIYALLFYAIIQLVMRAKQHQHRLICIGVFAFMCGSTVVNMGVVAGLFPTKGLPLPFISAGGTSLIANLFMIGLLSQINKAEREHNSLLASQKVLSSV